MITRYLAVALLAAVVAGCSLAAAPVALGIEANGPKRIGNSGHWVGTYCPQGMDTPTRCHVSGHDSHGGGSGASGEGSGGGGGSGGENGGKSNAGRGNGPEGNPDRDPGNSGDKNKGGD